MILHPVSLHQVTGCFHNNTITLLETTHEFRSGKLMLASLTLVASGVGFATRTAVGGDWEREFNIGGAEFGAILALVFSVLA